MEPSNLARESQESPASGSYAVTTHDTNEIGTIAPRALWVGTGGDITGQLLGDTASVVFKNVPDGALLPFKFRVIATATTASDLVAIY